MDTGPCIGDGARDGGHGRVGDGFRRTCPSARMRCKDSPAPSVTSELGRTPANCELRLCVGSSPLAASSTRRLFAVCSTRTTTAARGASRMQVSGRCGSGALPLCCILRPTKALRFAAVATAVRTGSGSLNGRRKPGSGPWPWIRAIRRGCCGRRDCVPPMSCRRLSGAYLLFERTDARSRRTHGLRTLPVLGSAVGRAGDDPAQLLGRIDSLPAFSGCGLSSRTRWQSIVVRRAPLPSARSSVSTVARARIRCSSTAGQRISGRHA